MSFKTEDQRKAVMAILKMKQRMFRLRVYPVERMQSLRSKRWVTPAYHQPVRHRRRR